MISELAEHWRRKSSADIPDTEIVDAYSAVAAAAARLPSGSGFAPFMSNLQAQDPDTLEGFKRDLGARARPARRVQEGRPPARCPTATPRSVVAQSARFSSHSTCHRARRAESSLSNLLVSDSQTPSPQPPAFRRWIEAQPARLACLTMTLMRAWLTMTLILRLLTRHVHLRAS